MGQLQDQQQASYNSRQYVDFGNLSCKLTKLFGFT